MKNIRQRRSVLALIKGMVSAVIFNVMIFSPQIHAQAVNGATVYFDSACQVIRGFGAANILPWRPDMTADQVNTAFGTGDGQLGFTILRLRVPYTDDTTEFAAQVPSAALAESMGAIVFASPWTPPPAMKSNTNIVGGMLSESSYADYAAHLKRFADYMAAHGAPLYAISLQNEPDANVTYESCYWNATQFLNFTKNNAASIGLRIIMPESESFVHQLSDSTLNDSAAAANVSIIGGHLYGASPASYSLATGKGKDLWMTEYLSLDTTWSGVLATGQQINDCMKAGMNAYVYWYIIRYYGPINENGIVTKRGYVMSQYSKFVRPGFTRVYTASNVVRGPSISFTAYRNNSQLVIVAVNPSSSSTTQTFNIPRLTGGSAVFTPYVTSATKNCNQGINITASNDSLTATLDGSSITTFVANGVTTGVDAPMIPQTIKLSQNYPNPFNPTTQIAYTIPHAMHVSLKVYNLLGQEVATLVEGIRQSGQYEVTFNATGLASGIYLYRLSANNFSETKKLILLK
ncbi:MAG: T9SS type A sorting domain-containing protein [Bacteroidota bacterium]